MSCVIKNNKNVYIKLNENGKPITCSETDKGLFEESKAKNILSCLPKTLQKLGFKIKVIPDIISINSKINNEQFVENVIKKENYLIPDEIKKWVEKFGICDDIIQEAKLRKDELYIARTNIDRELSNILHKIELEKSKNARDGYKDYKDLKDVLEERRIIKDELMIINSILNMNFKNFNVEVIDKAVAGLASRKFALRIVEEDDELNAM